jgi:hypothetical protein
MRAGAAVFLLTALLFSSSSFAQVQRRQPNTSGPSALESHTARLEHDAAEDLKAGQPSTGYFVDLDMVFPTDRAEYEAVGKYALLVFALFSDDRGALPLTRVFVGSASLKCLEPISRDVPPASDTAKTFGKFRADTLCVLPIDAERENNKITIDFAKTYKGIEVSYPSEEPDFVKADINPRSSSVPDPVALEQFITREYPGFGFRVRP